MLKEKVSRTVSILLLISITTLAVNIQPVKADSSWVWVRDTVTGAYGEAVVGTGADIYIARGNSFYRYRPANNSWTELAAPPQPDGAAFKTGTALAWDFGDRIYALCGAATDDSRRWFYRYSISSNSWETLANTTADQGEGNAITWVSMDNCIYTTIGGEQRPTYFMRYDPSTNSWSDAPADPPAGMGDGASLVWTGSDYLYALRGEFLETEALYDFWRYSLTDNSWTAMSDFPALPHSEGSGGVGDGGSLLSVGHWLPSHTNYIYALSGNQAHPDNIPDNRTYRYTISTNSWERLADLHFGVGYYVGCRLGYAEGHIYAWQGAPSTWAGGGDDLAKYRLAWIVDDDGPADFHTIQAAIDAANPGDTIYVYNGTYYELLSVNKNNLTLVGENPSTTIIDGGSPTMDVSVVTVSADNVNIRGFTIQHSGIGIWNAGIHLNSATNCNITENSITSNIVGVWLYSSSSNNIISRNNITNNDIGVGLEESSNNNNIFGNNITNNSVNGIYLLESCNNNIISENTIMNNTGYSDGIDIQLSHNNVISKNVIISNGYGIVIRDHSSSNIIFGNAIANSSSHGVALYSSYNTVSGNNITNAYYGIEIFQSSYNIITENSIVNNNQTGIWLDGYNYTFDNDIYHNNFINNTQQVSIDEYATDKSIWDDGYPSGGNYWSDYAGVDSFSGPYQNETDNDGIGDTFYYRDRYPLMKPWGYQLPIGLFTYSPEYPFINKAVTFNASPSYDRDGSITSYEWNFGDGNITTVTTPIITHIYTAAGTYTVNLTITDNDDLTHSTIRSITVTEDSAPPTTVDDYDGLWQTTDFTITLTATDDMSGVGETYYKINDGPTKAVSADGQPLITTEGANNKLEYWSVDKAGNEESHHILTGIKLDKTAPMGIILINNGDVYTTSTSVTLTLNSTDVTSGVLQVRYSNDGVWDTEPWETPSPTKTWTLTLGEGIKAVYYQIKDNAGLISDMYSDIIILDTSPPTGSISINDGATYTTTTSITLTLSATDATSGVAEMRFSNGNTTYSEWQTYTTSKSWTLQEEDGTKIVYVQFRDNAGLVSTYSAIIILDTTLPTGLSQSLKA